MIAYLIWGTILLLGLVKRKSWLVAIIIAVYAILTIGLNTYSADYARYFNMYININSGKYVSYEPIYVLLNRLCLSMGLSFAAFRCVISAIGLIIILIAAKKLSNNQAFFLTILIIYPVFGFISGIRSLIAFSISLLGVQFLVRDENKALLKYFLCISIAVLFHYSYIVYLIIPMWEKISKPGNKLTVFVLEIIAFFLWERGVLFRIVSKVISHQKVLAWFNPSYYPKPSLIAGIVICGFMYAIWYLMRSLLKENMTSIIIKSKCEEGLMHVKNAIGILDLNVFFIPLLLINMNYERFLILPFAVGFAGLSNVEHFSRPKKYFEVIVLLIALFLCITINNIIHPNIYFSALEKNVIIQFLEDEITNLVNARWFVR